MTLNEWIVELNKLVEKGAGEYGVSFSVLDTDEDFTLEDVWVSTFGNKVKIVIEED